MSNSKLLLTAAISVGLALGPAQAGPSFEAIPHASGVTQTQWHHHGWGWGSVVWGSAQASSLAPSLPMKPTRLIRDTFTMRVPTMAPTTIPRITAATRANAHRISAHSIGTPASTRPTQMRGGSVPT